MKFITFIVSILILIAACEDDEPVLVNKDLIFTHSYPIEIPAYEYTDPVNSNHYTVRGDSGFNSFPDTISPNPVFLWYNFGIQLLSVAVFTQTVDVQGGEISNPDDIIWEWHTGMNSEKDDTVQYSEGRNVYNGTVEYDEDVVPLEEGLYYWAIWGWGSSGTTILYSSRLLSFYVRNDDVRIK